MLCFFIFSALGVVTVKLGKDIEAKLSSGGKVAPSGDSKADKKAEKKGKEEQKIFIMVSRLRIVLVIVLLYFLYDVAISVGKLRHVAPPLCKATNVFIRPPSFIQMFAMFMIMRYFAVKNPNASNSRVGAGMTTGTGTTVATTTSSA